MKFESSRELTLYFREVESTSHSLTREEESVLIPLAKSGDSKALNRVVNSCSKMVVKTANKYMGQGVPVMDLVQEGNIGTIEALKRFDTEGKARFASYAQLWIKKFINDSVATVGRTVRLPMNHEFDIFKAKKAGKEVANLNNVRLDKKVDEDGNTTFGDLLNTCQPEIESIHHKEFISELVDKYMEKIEKEKDREIIKAYFGIGKEYPLTGESLAEEFGMSKVGINKLINRTMTQLSAVAI
jgi:RNA polymerase primary sigma factor